MNNNQNTATAVRPNMGNNVQQNEEKKDAYYIKMERPADFDPCQELSITTTRDLSYAVNGVFKGAFSDYMGCNLVVVPVPNAGFVITPYLYFRLLPPQEYTNDKFFAFEPTMMKGKQNTFVDTLSLLTNPNMTASARMAAITEDGKTALAEFIPHPKNQQINWPQQYAVKTVDGETIISLTSANIYPIVKKIYGGKDEENSMYDYTITPTKQMALDNSGSANWVLNIQRKKEKALSRSLDKVGYIYRGGSIPMVRAE